MPWNDFPKYIRKSFFKNIYEDIPQKEKNNVNKDDIPTNWIRLLYTILGIKANIYWKIVS